ncbi:gamma-glutamylcyclotransferase [Yinghuangia sp. ASG 101]|uniref:gamma-glutamylcyclotransferase family protein n=1 Tax=Yinghuangia sp. ASG 101 TaxID=2896848 RepID=UPI001E609266|nr:gamma-glutamylcyclotransferase family protein [Yinghuangia sp. ASG 101]UGQ09660.1 gamma-glutamylcyclotransferase [Yinghuangia sp. ASG 101]
MFPEVLDALLDRVPEHTAAAVDGRGAVTVSGRVYPVLTRGTGRVRGHLLVGLGDAEWDILDAFEDDLYDLVRLPLADGGHAWSYVAPDGFTGHEGPWSPEEFARRHLASYLVACRTWRAGYRGSVTS